MKYFKNIYSISLFLILIFFLSADKKVENIYNNNFYITIVFLLSIIYLTYNNNNVNIFLFIILIALYLNSDMKNRFNYEYFNNKFENTSMKVIKDKFSNLSELYYSKNNDEDIDKKQDTEQDTEQDKYEKNIDNQPKNDIKNKEEEILKLFEEVGNDISNIMK